MAVEREDQRGGYSTTPVLLFFVCANVLWPRWGWAWYIGPDGADTSNVAAGQARIITPKHQACVGA